MLIEKRSCEWIIPDTSLLNDEDAFINTYFDVLHFFNIDKIGSEVCLKISVDSNYTLYINGHFVGTGQYSDYPDQKAYDSYDITSLLNIGINSLAVTWYFIGESSSVYIAGVPRLFFSIESEKELITDTSASSQVYLRRSPGYRSGRIEKITPQLFFSCSYDARNDDDWLAGSYSPETSGHGWVLSVGRGVFAFPLRRPVDKCTFEEILPVKIAAQGFFADEPNSSDLAYTPAQRMQTALMSSRRLRSLISLAAVPATAPLQSPVLPSKHGFDFKHDVTSGTSTRCQYDGIYLIIDLGREDTGHICLDIDAPEGTDIDISFGEHLDDLRVRSYIDGRHFAVRYTCGKGRNKWTDYFRRSGLRYLQINVHAYEFTLYYAGIHPEHYPVRMLHTVLIDDPLNKRIYETGIRTLKLCMHEHYEDCPWREQALYTMDSRNQILTGYYCFDNSDFVRSNIDLMGGGLRDDGLLELCFPGKVPVTIPGFSLMFVVILEEYCAFSKDYEFVSTHFDTAAKILDTFLLLKSANGLVPAFSDPAYWNFYEWSDGLDGARTNERNREVSYDSPLNAFLSAALRSFSGICDLLGRKSESSFYQQAHKNLNVSINSVFWSEAADCYASFYYDNKLAHFCELTQSLLSFCDAVPGSRIDEILELLSSKSSPLIPISLSHSIFKYDALMTQKARYEQYVLEDIRSKWGRMIEKGATTFWETEEGADAFDFAGSLCHGWSAVPVYIYGKYFRDNFL